jgi:hypothetical protein
LFHTSHVTLRGAVVVAPLKFFTSFGNILQIKKLINRQFIERPTSKAFSLAKQAYKLFTNSATMSVCKRLCEHFVKSFHDFKGLQFKNKRGFLRCRQRRSISSLLTCCRRFEYTTFIFELFIEFIKTAGFLLSGAEV